MSEARANWGERRAPASALGCKARCLGKAKYKKYFIQVSDLVKLGFVVHSERGLVARGKQNVWNAVSESNFVNE